jgi:hypothetical protein
MIYDLQIVNSYLPSIITDSSGAVFFHGSPHSTSSGRRLRQAQGVAFESYQGNALG